MSLQTDNIAESARSAAGRIAGIVRETPLEKDSELSKSTGADVYLKLASTSASPLGIDPPPDGDR